MAEEEFKPPTFSAEEHEFVLFAPHNCDGYLFEYVYDQTTNLYGMKKHPKKDFCKISKNIPQKIFFFFFRIRILL